MSDPRPKQDAPQPVQQRAEASNAQTARRVPNRRQLAYIAAAIVILTGLLGLVNPLVAIRLFGLEVIDPRGISQVRATFGGMYLALGGMLLWAATPRASAAGNAAGRPYLRSAALLVGCVAAGRLLSVVIDGILTPLNLLFLAFEVAVALLALLASRSPRSSA